MSQIPPLPQEEPEGKTLNLLGRYIKAFIDIFGISQSELATRIGISSSSLSSAMYGDAGMMRETATELIRKCELLAEMKDIKMPPTWQFHLSGAMFDTGNLEIARQSIEHFEMMALWQRELTQLKEENAKLKDRGFRQKLLAQIQEVRQDNELLRTENFKLRQDNEWLRRTRGNA